MKYDFGTARFDLKAVKPHDSTSFKGDTVMVIFIVFRSKRKI